MKALLFTTTISTVKTIRLLIVPMTIRWLDMPFKSPLPATTLMTCMYLISFFAITLMDIGPLEEVDMARTLPLMELLQMLPALALLIRLPVPSLICGIMERSMPSSLLITGRPTQTSQILKVGAISPKLSGQVPLLLVALPFYVMPARSLICQLGLPFATMGLLVSAPMTVCVF